MRVAFIVGDVATVSGGSSVIFEHAAALQRRGHEVHLLAQRHDAAAAPWHPRLATLPVRAVSDAADERFDFAFATWWMTVFDLFRVDAAVYGHLTQSLEARFHPEPWFKLLNRCTYALPLLTITEAAWLAELVRMVQPAARVLHVPNGLSREWFPCVAAPPRRDGPLRVLVEGTWRVPFKGVPETFEVLEQAHAAGVRCEVGWLTVDAAGARPTVGGRPVAVHERVPMAGVKDVLRRHDVLLKLSRVEGVYGPPLEMFSQGGTAITYTVTGSDAYVVHGHNGLLVEPFNRGQIVRYLELLDRGASVLEALRRNALETARRHPGWEESGGALADALERIHAEGWSNASLRGPLAALAAVEDRWLDDVARLRQLGGSPRLVLDAVRQAKASAPAQLLKRTLAARRARRERAAR